MWSMSEQIISFLSIDSVDIDSPLEATQGIEIITTIRVAELQRNFAYAAIYFLSHDTFVPNASPYLSEFQQRITF